MMQSDKLRRLLGQNMEEHLNTVFQPNSAGSLRQYAEFESFWSQMEDKGDAIKCIDYIGNKLLTFIENPQQATVSIGSIINTLQLFALYIPFRVILNPRTNKPKRVKFLAAFEAGEKSQSLDRSSPYYLPLQGVFRTMKKVHQNEPILTSLLNQMCQMHTQGELKALQSDVPAFQADDTAPNEACMTYNYVMTQASLSEQNRVAVLTTCANLVRTLNAVVKTQPQIAEGTLQALLFMTHSIMKMAPVFNGSVAMQLAKNLQEFYLWPEPFGGSAQKVLKAISSELHHPGRVMRDSFEREFRTGFVSDTKENGQLARPIHWFLMTKASSIPYVKIMNLRSWRSVPETKGTHFVDGEISPTAKCLSVMNAILKNAGLTAEEAQHFRSLNVDQVQELYSALVASDTKEEAKDRRLALMALKTQAMGMQVQSGTDAVTLPEQFTDDYLPALPPLQHLYVSGEGVPFDILDSSALRMMQLNHVPYPTTPFTEPLKALLSQFKGTEDKPVDLRVVVAGGNKVMHMLLAAYANLLQEDLTEPEKRFDCRRLKFYLVPLSVNWLSQFVARHDCWYNRHIFKPFSANAFFIPWFRVARGTGANETKRESKTVTKPGQFYRGLVDSYVRDAEECLPIKLWQVEGWHSLDGDQKRPGQADQNIPMMMKFEVGLHVDGREYQRRRVRQAQQARNENQSGMFRTMSIEEVTRHRDFVYNAPELNISFRPVDMSGVPDQEDRKDEGVSYKRLIVNNLATLERNNEQPHPASPTDPWLELFASPSKVNKGRYNALSTCATAHINVLDISCQNPEGSFMVEVDGTRFGPYARVRVSPMVIENDEQLEFPVSTFCPVSV